jgi:hypothetical protein
MKSGLRGSPGLGFHPQRHVQRKQERDMKLKLIGQVLCHSMAR